MATSQFNNAGTRIMTVEKRIPSLNKLSGIMHPHDSTALDTEEGIWDLTMQINLKGVWWGCKYAIVAMRNNPVDSSKGLKKGGSIINTASFVALMGAATPQLACSFLPPPSKIELLSRLLFCLQILPPKEACWQCRVSSLWSTPRKVSESTLSARQSPVYPKATLD